MADSAEFEEIVDNFELFDDWEDRYRYVIELGRSMPPLPDDEKTPETKVDGCVSQVWLVPEIRSNGGGDALYFQGDSDAMIVRGLAAIILVALNGKAPRDLLATDIDELFEQLDLFRHISPTRGNGLRAMVGKIRDTAARVATA